jgi:hypothetical protein
MESFDAQDKHVSDVPESIQRAWGQIGSIDFE